MMKRGLEGKARLEQNSGNFDPCTLLLCKNDDARSTESECLDGSSPSPRLDLVQREGTAAPVSISRESHHAAAAAADAVVEWYFVYIHKYTRGNWLLE